MRYWLFARDASKLKMRVRLDDDALPVQVVLVAGEIGENMMLLRLYGEGTR